MRFHSLGPTGLGRALFLSLVIHLFLFWPQPPGREAPGPQTLEATLRPAATPAPPAPAPRPAAPAAQARPRVLASHGLPAAAAPPPAPAVPANTILTGESAGRSGSDPAPRPAADRPLPVPPGDGLDAEGLRGYRVALAREARRHKRYPRQAIEAGWQGTTELQVSLLVDGRPGEVRVFRSSGHGILDEAAREMLSDALDATPVPAALLGRSFTVHLPVVFEASAQ